jgi:hypothetical protein
MPNDVLQIEDLRTAVGLALDAFVATHGPEVGLTHDLYWHLQTGDLFEMSRVPTEMTVGQTTDDLAEVRQMLDSGDFQPAWHALLHIGGLLRLVEHTARP